MKSAKMRDLRLFHLLCKSVYLSPGPLARMIEDEEVDEVDFEQ